MILYSIFLLFLINIIYIYLIFKDKLPLFIYVKESSMGLSEVTINKKNHIVSNKNILFYNLSCLIILISILLLISNIYFWFCLNNYKDICEYLNITVSVISPLSISFIYSRNEEYKKIINNPSIRECLNIKTESQFKSLCEKCPFIKSTEFVIIMLIQHKKWSVKWLKI